MADEMTTELTVEQKLNELLIEKLGGRRVVSPYKMSTILTEVLGKKVQGPQIYQARNEKWGFEAYQDEMDRWTVDHDEALRYMTKFALRRLSK